MTSVSSLLLCPGTRIFTFFFLSPLFYRQKIPWSFQLGSATALTLALAFVPKGPCPLTPVFFLTEVATGYLLGFLVLVFFEAARLAGELLGALWGFSFSETLNPLASPLFPLFTKIFFIFITALFLAFDFHHALLKLFAASFSLPSMDHLIAASGKLFPYALQLIALPLTLYAFFIATLAFASKMLPEIPLFFLSVPLQIFLGVTALLLSLNNFPSVIQRLFTDFLEIIAKVLV